MQILQVEQVRRDYRGTLTQVGTGKWKQYNFIKLKEGNTLGGHYHKLKEEEFYVIRGSFVLEIKKVNNNMPELYTFEQNSRFVIEPYDIHTITALEDTELVELITEPYDPEDTYGN